MSQTKIDEWKEVELWRLLTEKGYIRWPFWSALKRWEMKDNWIPVYEQQNAIYNHRNFRYFIDQEKYNTLKRFTVQENDMVISCSWTLGRVTKIKKNDPIWIISQALLILRPDTGIVEPQYLKYFLSSKRWFNSMVSRSSWSVQVNLAKRPVIESIPFLLPPLPEQKNITSVLSSFDDKIELLREQNETLEKIAQTLFKEWFGKYSVDRPDELPEGWRVWELSELINHIKKSLMPATWEMYSHYSIPWFDNWMTPSQDNWEDILSSKYEVQANSFLVSKLNPWTPRVWTVLDPMDNGVCSWEFQVMKPKETNFFSYAYSILNSNTYTRSMWMSAHWTSSSHQRIKPSDILDYEIIIPDEDKLTDYNNIILPMINKMDSNRSDIVQLSKTRDALLPKLMSGKVRVRF